MQADDGPERLLGQFGRLAEEDAQRHVGVQEDRPAQARCVPEQYGPARVPAEHLADKVLPYVASAT